MEGSNIGPRTRKPIHGKLDYNEIRDNVKNNAIMAQSERQRNISQTEVDDEQEIFSSDNEEEYLATEERLVEESGIRRATADDRLRKREKVPALSAARVRPVSPTRTAKLSPKILESNVRFSSNAQEQMKNCNHSWWKFLTLVVVFFIVIAYTSGCFNASIFLVNDSGEFNSIEYVLDNVKRTLLSLQFKYKNQDKDLWAKAYHGISELIKRPYKPSIILLLGEKSDPMDCLAILLSNVSSNALNTASLTLLPNEFPENMGLVIEDLRVRTRNHKTVVIWDLLNINVEALKAFHNLCDTVNPLVEEVIFIITIIADNIHEKATKPIEFLENELFKKLSGKMKDDAIQPLIIRITDGPILIVKPEPTVTDCPLPKALKT